MRTECHFFKHIIKIHMYKRITETIILEALFLKKLI